MARKTFISYKYSEATETRDRIIKSLKDDATYYRGEKSLSPNLKDDATETIKRKLSNMIRDTTVTIVVLSPNMIRSEWMEWEIKFSLKETTKEDKTSRRNGIVVIIQKDKNGSYDWIKKYNSTGFLYNDEKLFPVIVKNRSNKKQSAPSHYSENYIDIINEDDFLLNAPKHIENAFEKSQNYHHYSLFIENK